MHRLLVIFILSIGSLTLPAFGDTLCADANCTVNLTFSCGGSLSADQGAILSFGTNAEISLGESGSYFLGDGGQLRVVSDGQIILSGSIPEQGQIVLGVNGRINFGTGGFINLGLGGNIEYVQGYIVNIVGAETVDIQAESGGSVRVGDINTNGGTIVLSARNFTMEDAAIDLTGILIESQSSTSTISINASFIYAFNISAAGLININTEQPGDLCGDPVIPENGLEIGTGPSPIVVDAPCTVSAEPNPIVIADGSQDITLAPQNEVEPSSGGSLFYTLLLLLYPLCKSCRANQSF